MLYCIELYNYIYIHILFDCMLYVCLLYSTMFCTFFFTVLYDAMLCCIYIWFVDLPSCQNTIKLYNMCFTRFQPLSMCFSTFIVSEVWWQKQVSTPWRWSPTAPRRSRAWSIVQRNSWRIMVFGWTSGSCMQTITRASTSCSMDTNGWVHFCWDIERYSRPHWRLTIWTSPLLRIWLESWIIWSDMVSCRNVI